jgi:hypothetical protein
VGEMIAIVETEEFLADVKDVLSENEHDALILYLAQRPEAGDLIPETGGLRKLPYWVVLDLVSEQCVQSGDWIS